MTTIKGLRLKHYNDRFDRMEKRLAALEAKLADLKTPAKKTPKSVAKRGTGDA